MRLSLGIIGALLSFQGIAGSCLLAYDPFGIDGKVPFVHSLTQVSRDRECSSVIFYPPIPRLGYVNSQTGIQKIPFDSQEKRELVLNFLTQESFVDDIYEAEISEEGYLAFQKALKENESVTKSITLFHGSPLSIAPTNQPHQGTSSERRGEVVQGLFQKDQWSYADLLTLTQSASKRVQGLVKMLKTDGENYINPCANEYSKYIASLDLTIPTPNEALYEEAQALAAEYKSLTGKLGRLSYLVQNEKLCSMSEKAYSLLQKHYTAPKSDEAYCKIRAAQTLFYFEATECFKKLRTNLMNAKPISGMVSNSHNLVLSCIIGKEKIDAELDSPFREALMGCPDEIAALDSQVRLSRKSASLKSARLLCDGATKDAQISVGLISALIGQTDSKLLPIEENISLSGTTVPSSAEEILQSLVYASPTNCVNKFADIIRKHAAATQRTNEVSAASRNVEANYASIKKLQDFSKQYCHSDELLSEKEKETLKKDLLDAHSFILFKDIYGIDYDEPVPKLYSESEMKKLIKYHELDAQLKAQYDKLELSTKTAQALAAKRLLFLKEAGQKALGFFDCYECDGKGGASLISCKKMERTFKDYALMGEGSDLKKLRDPEVVMKRTEASINSAGKLPLPVCNTKMPPCKFNENCDPPAPATHTSPTPPTKKTLKERFFDYFKEE